MSTQLESRRPTDDELDERIEYTQFLLSQGLFKTAIKQALRKQFGPLDHGTIERYLTRARARILDAVHEEKANQRCWALAFYRSVLADRRVEMRDKVRAQERIDRLLGLEVRLPVNLQVLLEALGISLESLTSGAPAALGLLTGQLPPESVPGSGDSEPSGPLPDGPGGVSA